MACVDCMHMKCCIAGDMVPAVTQLRMCASQVAQMLVDAKCDDVSTFDVRHQCDFADHFVVSTARSHRHVITAANAIIYQVCQCSCLKHQAVADTARPCQSHPATYCLGIL